MTDNAPQSLVLSVPGGSMNLPVVRLSWITSTSEPPPWIDLTMPDGQRVRYRRG